MENVDMKYNRILEKIKRMEPVLDDAEGLADSIMRNVEQRAARTGRIRMMRILGNMSGIAASALICLFAYETLKYPVLPADNLCGTKPAATAESIYSHNSGELNNRKKAEIIENILKNREAQRVRKELTTKKYMKSLN